MDLADDISYSVHDVEDAIVAGRFQLALDRGRRTSAPAPSTAPGTGTCPREAGRVHRRPPPAGGHRGMGAARRRSPPVHGRAEGHDQPVHRPFLFQRRWTPPAPSTGPQPLTRFKGTDRAAGDRARDRRDEGPRHRVRHDLRTAPAGLRAPAATSCRTGGRAARHRGELPGDPVRLRLARRRDDAGQLRVVIDQVASLTDVSALALHERLMGAHRTLSDAARTRAALHRRPAGTPPSPACGGAAADLARRHNIGLWPD